jgi:hypothetical protein
MGGYSDYIGAGLYFVLAVSYYIGGKHQQAVVELDEHQEEEIIKMSNKLDRVNSVDEHQEGELKEILHKLEKAGYISHGIIPSGSKIVPGICSAPLMSTRSLPITTPIRPPLIMCTHKKNAEPPIVERISS